MAANNLGTAYIKIAPQMEGIQGAITKGLQSAAKSSVAGATALGTVVAKGMSTAMNAVTNSMDRAISRVDTLNAFPKIMKNLGFSTEESTSAIEKLSNRIEGLPTGLDEIVNYTQRLASTMGNLNKDVYNATNLAIAFNDAALAGGKGQYEANRAFEQFSQVLSRGRPSMQDWKIMMEVMPGQLKQMAKYMGTNNKSLQEYAKNAKKTVDQLDGMDLYNWISENKNEKAKERLQDFTKALVDLDNKGGAGITSFKDQVGDATHTIGNALRLIPLRISKAMAEIIQEFGAGDVYNAIDKFTSKFKDVGKWIAKNIVPIIKNQVVPVLKTALGVVKSIVEYIAANKWVQTFLVGLLQTIIAFKAISAIKTAITGIITPIISMVGNLKTAITTFASARAAGLTLSTSLGAVASSTTGATSAMTGLAGGIGGVISKAAGLTGGLAGLGIAMVGIGGAIFNVNMVIQELNRQQQIAAYKAREFASAQINLENAQKHVNDATRIGKDILNDYKNALDASKSTELDMLNAKQQVEYRQSELNRLTKEGKQGSDEYRIAQLELEAAQAALAKKTKEHETATKNAADALTQYKDNSLTALQQLNLLNISTEAQGRQYGVIAAQLDTLSTKTLTYKDANGVLTQATKEDSEAMSGFLAEQLAKTDSTWAGIVQIAQEKGISFSEACKQYAAEGGRSVPGQFAVGLQSVSSLATDATQDLTEQIKTAADMKEDAKIAGDSFTKNLAKHIAETENLPVAEANKLAVDVVKELGNHKGELRQIGVQMTQGTAQGILDQSAKARLLANAYQIIKAAVAKMKAAADEHSPSKETAEIGKFMSLGLAKGIDDYADEAVKSAQEMTQKTIDAMSGSAVLDGNIAQFQPQTALTSGMNGSGGQVIQNNEFYVDSELDVKDVSKRLGWQVATAL